MRTLTITLLLLLSQQVFSDAAALDEVMSNAHQAGRCSVFFDLADFQKDNQMESGDAFVVSFIKNQAKRNNTSFEELLRQCENETSKYKALSNVITEQKMP